MTLKNPLKPLTPHGERRLTVHFWILLLLAVIAFCASGCATQKTGCESLYKNKRKFVAWIKYIETKKVSILDKDGAIICTYIDNK